MPDTKVSALTDGTTANSTDRIPVARDAGGGTFNNRYVTPGYIGTTLLGSGTALTGSTVTTSSPVLNLTQTWNAGAVTFTGLRFNATDTASASGSLLLDIGTGGGSYTSAFNVTKTGGFTFNDTATTTGTTPWRFLAPNLTSPGGATIFVGKDTNTGARLTYDALLSSAVVGVNISGTTAHVTLLAGGTGGFLYLRPGSSGATQLGAADAAAPVAQTFKVQSVVGSTPGASDVAGANFTIQGSAGRGSGAGGSIIFQVAPAGSAGTGAQNAYSTALTIDSTRLATFGGNISGPINANLSITTGSAGYALLLNGGASIFSDRLRINAGAFLSFFSSSVDDVTLYRDTSNTLALRNGTNAQKFRVYNTYTSSTNYENFEIDWQTTANIALVGPTKGSGGGTQRVQRLQYLEDGGTGSTTPSLGTTCPAASATIKSWIKVITSDGTTAYIPCWA